MPGPDPHAVWIEESNGRYSAYFDAYFWTRNAGNREKRAKEMLRRFTNGDWVYRWCSDDLPEWRRVDALYCCQGCKKKAQRARRAARCNSKTTQYAPARGWALTKEA